MGKVSINVKVQTIRWKQLQNKVEDDNGDRRNSLLRIPIMPGNVLSTLDGLMSYHSHNALRRQGLSLPPLQRGGKAAGS